MFGLMLEMLAMMYNEYIRAYEAAHHRSSFPEPKENLLVPVSTRAYAKAKSWSEKSPLSSNKLKFILLSMACIQSIFPSPLSISLI